MPDENIQLNADWPARYAQYQRFAAHHNEQEIDKYRLAMANWRLNAVAERGLGRPIPPKPEPGTAWAAAWQQPREINQPVLIENAGPVCEVEPDNLPPESGQIVQPRPAGLVISIGEPMSTLYHAGTQDNAPDGYEHWEGGRRYRKHRSVDFGGNVYQYWERITDPRA